MNSPGLKLLSVVPRLNHEKLAISSLPVRQKLEGNVAIQHWINVSGVNIHQIYPKLSLPEDVIEQFDFADIFTEGILLTDFNDLQYISTDRYETISVLEHRQALLAAVMSLAKQLANGVTTGIFCHRGLARSPLVSASALNYYYQESLAISMQRVKHIHPPAYFTDISVSALFWLKERLQDPNFHNNKTL